MLGHRDLTDEDIRTAIKNSGGVRGSLLIPDAPFELLVRRSISRLLTPCLQCKDFVHAELLRIAGQCAPPDIARFPALQVGLWHSAKHTNLKGIQGLSMGETRVYSRNAIVTLKGSSALLCMPGSGFGDIVSTARSEFPLAGCVCWHQSSYEVWHVSNLILRPSSSSSL